MQVRACLCELCHYNALRHGLSLGAFARRCQCELEERHCKCGLTWPGRVHCALCFNARYAHKRMRHWRVKALLLSASATHVTAVTQLPWTLSESGPLSGAPSTVSDHESRSTTGFFQSDRQEQALVVLSKPNLETVRRKSESWKTLEIMA